MLCPYCKIDDDRVVDSRLIDSGNSIRRRRECLKCQRRFTTYERIEAVRRMVVKKDFRHELYDRNKILLGMRNACNKRGVSEQQLEEIADKIECELADEFDGEIETRIIGEKVSRHLKQLDRVAYLRFVSVYHEYSKIEQFLSEADSLRH